MSARWPLLPLGEVLTERREVPETASLLTGRVRIISKIGFADGQIEFRRDAKTGTDMILVRSGDLVVSGINAAKGAVAIYRSGAGEPAAATIHYGAYAVERTRADARFLWWLLRSALFRGLLSECMPGGIKTELSASRLLAVCVPMPSLEQQRRIVTHIDALSAKIAEAHGLRQKAVLERERLLGSAAGEATAHLAPTAQLGRVLTSAPRNGWSARCDNHQAGVPVLSLAAVTGFIYRSTEYKRTSEATSPSAHYWLRPGDLLVTRSNTPELVGHAAIYDGSPSPCIYPDLMMRLEVDRVLADTRFVHWWLQGPVARDYVRQAAKGTSPTMRKISGAVVSRLPFPAHASLAEQRRIVAYLDGLRTKVDALRRLQEETAAELAALLPAVLERAFGGQL